ncbi:glycoside hydrolase family 2 protein [Parathielavia appendiculata]|uniref:Glycoside hydrolase family 2 protein n=1 Tax=Parathielavia appendiculata TaxID=2587402 RepID=A0AAN6YZT9_9PEZI|nr:glycoside hydrolase family 2 protein [Parathielavia appendiculata]
MHMKRTAAALSIAARLQIANAAVLVAAPRQTAAIPSWDLQSSAVVANDPASLSQTGLNTTSWHHVPVSKCTLMGCLIEAGVYTEKELFYSDNLRRVDGNQFLVPWIYRHEFLLDPGPGHHYFLRTHGISSRADIFLNGRQVAASSEQAGSYVGRTYEITNLVGKENALAIQVYPTDYYRDLALGWVDWNPWPADNGTGVWRDVEVKLTGPVKLDPMRVVTHLGTPLETAPANVTIKAKVHNLEDRPVTVTAAGLLTPVSGGRLVGWNQTFTLPPLSATDLILSKTITNPKIWWPRQWGAQPLYKATLTLHVANFHHPSDHATVTFGLRTITTTLNAHNDITFHVNTRPFQILGAGYTPNLFLRSSPSDWDTTLQYLLDLGFNTIRLEGKNEHPWLYAAADRLGVMILPGWECCDKWEAWEYNADLGVQPVPMWSDADYDIARRSMLHEAGMMQAHASVLGFLIGSDYWPDERATRGYLEAFETVDWEGPVIGSASKRGFSEQTGPSGMKMEGPYDWVPPGYWWNTEPAEERRGAAFGFGSELGAGVGTPELGSLREFLTGEEIESLWRNPNRSQFHMSRETSQFETRKIYNAALWKRWGAPSSLEDYLIKVQLMDYEATRAQVEAYSAMWNAKRPATGMIYWMLNNGWPSLHWNLWDYYMRPAGSYFGAKAGGKVENTAFDYVKREVWLVNRSLDKGGARKIEVEVMDMHGRSAYKGTAVVTTAPNSSQKILSLDEAFGNVTEPVFLRLLLWDAQGREQLLSRNVYWVAKDEDVLDWDKSEWYVTPASKYSDYTALNRLSPAQVAVSTAKGKTSTVDITLENKSAVPAFFVSLKLVDYQGRDVLPVTWDDNYVTVWPGESLAVQAKAPKGVDKENWQPSRVLVGGKNVDQGGVDLN